MNGMLAGPCGQWARSDPGFYKNVVKSSFQIQQKFFRQNPEWQGADCGLPAEIRLHESHIRRREDRTRHEDAQCQGCPIGLFSVQFLIKTAHWSVFLL